MKNSGVRHGVKRQLFGFPVPTPDLLDKVQHTEREFLLWAEAEAGHRPNTIDAYRRDLADFGRFLRGKGRKLDRVRPGDVLSYLRRLRRDGRAEATLGRRFACLRTYFRFLVAEGHVAKDPTLALDAPRKWRTLPKVPTKEEVEALLGVMPDTVRGRRDRALFELLYATGARVGEILGAKRQDYHADLQVLKLHGKGGKQRVVPVGKHARQALAIFHNETPARTDEPLIGSLRGRPLTRDRVLRMLKEYAAQAGVRPAPTPHGFRHAFATHMLEGNADIRAVQELLGHASVATTQLYTHVEQERLRSIHNRYHPRA